MARWTKKAALERMDNNLELRDVCQQYPLAAPLVKSAAKLRRYRGYNEQSCYSAYKVWLRAAISHGESPEYYVCLRAIYDLLPIQSATCSIFSDNPVLPDLPPFPPHEPRGEGEPVFLTASDLFNPNHPSNRRSDRRQVLLRSILEEVRMKQDNATPTTSSVVP